MPGTMQRHPQRSRRVQKNRAKLRKIDDTTTRLLRSHTEMAIEAGKTPVQKLSENLGEMPTNMRLFSLTLRSLYADKAVSGKEEVTKQINELRDDTRRDAMTYKGGILPICTNVVRTIKDFFENYEVLDFEEWKDALPDIIKEVDGYIQLCAVSVKLHKDIMVPLKQRQDTARVLLRKVEDLNEVYESQMEELQAGAKKSKGWAFALSFVPGVNAIATPILIAKGDSKLAKAVAKSSQMNVNNAAVLAIRDALIPALTEFIAGIDSIAGFFSAMKQELTSFQDRGKESVDEPKVRHFKLMKNEAAVIMDNCRKFFAVIPGMETDLEAIPEEGTDLNYVDEWLATEEAEIRKEYDDAISPCLKEFLDIFSKKKSRKRRIEHTD